MEQLWDRQESPEKVENLRYVLKKMRGTLNKMRRCLENERAQRYGKNPKGTQECARIVHEIQDCARILSLYVECEWSNDPVGQGLYHVQTIADILLPGGTELMKDITKTDKDAAWNVVSIWLKDKVLGQVPDKQEGLLAVYSRNSIWMTLEEAFEANQKRRK